MNRGKYLDSVDKAHQFLNSLSLVKEKNVAKIRRWDSDKFSRSFKKLSQKGRYVEVYKTGIQYNEYDILLTDFSFLQFSFDEDEKIVRYAYYPNPNKFKSYEEFLDRELEASLDEVGDTCIGASLLLWLKMERCSER